MQTTSNIENNIIKKADDIKSSINSTNQKIQATQQKIQLLKTEQIDIFRKIATFFLLESPNNDDVQIQSIINQLQELKGNLNNKSHTLEQIILNCQQKMTDILVKLDDLTTQKVLKLESDPDYVTLFNHFTSAEQSYEQETKNFEASQQEFSEKLAQYSQNRYYTYLIDRKFGEPDYKGFWIFANLDSWVARFINFSANYKNQKILEALLKESQLRFNTKQESYQLALEQKERKEHDLEASLKIPEVKVELLQIEQDLANYKKQKQDTDIAFNDTQSGQSIQFRKLSYQLANLLQQQSIDKLKKITQQTKTTKDDELLQEIPQLDKEIQQLETSLVKTQQIVGKLAQTYNGFTTTLYLFKKNNIPNGFYEYDISLSSLNNLLNNLINNSIEPEEIVQYLNLNRRQRKIRNPSSINRGWSVSRTHNPASSQGSSHSSSWHTSSRSSSSGKGFSTSSSSGGGGFRTTDSF